MKRYLCLLCGVLLCLAAVTPATAAAAQGTYTAEADAWSGPDGSGSGRLELGDVSVCLSDGVINITNPEAVTRPDSADFLPTDAEEAVDTADEIPAPDVTVTRDGSGAAVSVADEGEALISRGVLTCGGEDGSALYSDGVSAAANVYNSVLIAQNGAAVTAGIGSAFLYNCELYGRTALTVPPDTVAADADDEEREDYDSNTDAILVADHCLLSAMEGSECLLDCGGQGVFLSVVACRAERAEGTPLLICRAGSDSYITFTDMNSYTRWDATGAVSDATTLEGDVQVEEASCLTLSFANSRWSGTIEVADEAECAVTLTGLSSWTVTKSTHLTYLNISSGSTVSAPDGAVLRLTVDGEEMTLEPGNKYIGEIELEVFHFTDLQTYEYGREIQTLYEDGLTVGYSDGSYRPGRMYTRVEAAQMLYTLLELTAPDIEDFPPPEDVDGIVGSKATRAVLYAGWMDTDGDDLFRPYDGLTGDEFAALLQDAADALGLTAAFDLPEDGDTPITAGEAMHALYTLLYAE